MRPRHLVVLVWTLVLLRVFLNGPNVFASRLHGEPDDVFAPDRLVSDFDGDHRSDIAVSRIIGSTLNIKVRLSGADLRVFLKLPVGMEGGLQLLAYDVDDDNDIDLALISASSITPVAVWLNTNGNFEQTSEWTGPLLEREASERLHRGTTQTNPQDLANLGGPILFFETGHVPHRQHDHGRHSTENELFPRSRSVLDVPQRGPPLRQFS